MNERSSVLHRLPRWLREPVVHFFALGALLFAVHGVVAQDPHVIVVTKTLRADLARRFEDEQGRKPTAAELSSQLETWRQDEALYREALRRGLDRDDAGVRAALIGKMQAMAALEVPDRAPSDAELDAWLSAHRDRYQVPERFHYEFAGFSKSEADAERQRAAFERSVRAGADPASLGRPIGGGKLPASDLARRLPAEVAEWIPKLELGVWQRVDGPEDLWLVRVKQKQGDLPDRAELRPRLASDWATARRQKAVVEATQRLTQSYQLEERP